MFGTEQLHLGRSPVRHDTYLSDLDDAFFFPFVEASRILADRSPPGCASLDIQSLLSTRLISVNPFIGQRVFGSLS